MTPLPKPHESPLPDLASAAADAGLLDVAYATDDSPVGKLLLAATPRGLVRLAGVGTSGQLGVPRREAEAPLERLPDGLKEGPRPLVPGACAARVSGTHDLCRAIFARPWPWVPASRGRRLRSRLRPSSGRTRPRW